MVLDLFQVIRPYHPSLSLSFTTTMSMDIMRMTWVSVIMDHPSLNCRNRDFLAEERWFGKTDTISFATKTCTPFKLQVHSIHCQKKYFFSCYTMYQWRYFWKRVQVWIKTFFWSSISRYFYCDISCHDISVSFMTLSHKLSFYDIYYETICSAFALLKKSTYNFAKSVAIPQVVSLCFRIFVWCDFSIGATASSCAFGVIFVQFIKLNGWRWQSFFATSNGDIFVAEFFKEQYRSSTKSTITL